VKPAAYSHTDTAEILAINVFKGLLDVGRVKTHIRERDKIPNTDGHLDLLDDDLTPMGQIEVQVRKIKDDATSATCPGELIAYSSVNGLPMIYVGVDVKNKKAYWRHISNPMAEMPEGQKTCTIRFDPALDSIEAGSPYFQRWVGLAQDFQSRITDYPELKRKFTDTIQLTPLILEDRIWFQTFIDRVNQHLDANYPFVKSLFFADMWKMGVAVTSTGQDSVSFSLYKILRGENAPLIISLPGSLGHLFADGPAVKPIETGGTPVSTTYFRRGENANAEQMADKQITGYVSTVFQQKLLNLSGDLICTEFVFNFVDEFHHVLGLDSRDEYTLSALRRGIFVFFPQWYSIAFKRYCEVYADLLRNLPFPFFSAIAHSLIKPTVQEVEDRISSGRLPDSFLIRAEEVNFKAFIQALDVLFHKGIDRIIRPYAKKVQRGPFIWNAFDLESLKKNIPLILGSVHREYLALAVANQLDPRRLHHASDQRSRIYAAKLEEWPTSSFSRPPSIELYLVDNSDKLFAPVEFVNLSESGHSIAIAKREISRNGVTRPILGVATMDPHAFFGRLPLLNICYSWLADDLSGELNHQFSFTDF
jgi:hypothetical protein